MTEEHGPARTVTDRFVGAYEDNRTPLRLAAQVSEDGYQRHRGVSSRFSLGVCRRGRLRYMCAPCEISLDSRLDVAQASPPAKRDYWELPAPFMYPLTMETLPFEFAMENYPLAPLTLYQVGGPARLALLPRTLNEANDAYQWMVQQPERRIVLGGGSNVLIDDNGFDGIVFVTTKLDGIQPLGDDRYHVLAGVVLDRMVREVMLANNYDMVGGLTGIPGTVGGAIYMNAGTVNGSTCMLMESVDVATPEGLRTMPMDDSLYSYRGQTFCPPGSLIVGGTFRFTRAEKDQQAIYDHYIQRRKEKQPQGKCCGSVFKNPLGDHSGRLIEACGLKGTRHGGAQVSPLHANFIMNDDNATCADILALIDICKRTVQERFGVTLEEEVVYIH